MSLGQGRARFTQLLSVAAVHPSTVPSRQHFCGGILALPLSPALSWPASHHGPLAGHSGQRNAEIMRTELLADKTEQTNWRQHLGRPLISCCTAVTLPTSKCSHTPTYAYSFLPLLQSPTQRPQLHHTARHCSVCVASQAGAHQRSLSERLVHLCAPQPLQPVSRVLCDSAEALNGKDKALPCACQPLKSQPMTV